MDSMHEHTIFIEIPLNPLILFTWMQFVETEVCTFAAKLIKMCALLVLDG